MKKSGFGHSVNGLVAVILTLGTAKAVDHNGDGMSDVWQHVFDAFGIPPAGDEDGDGQTNLKESVAWTDPYDADDVLRLEIEFQSDGSHILSWEERTGISYRIEASSDLES